MKSLEAAVFVTLAGAAHVAALTLVDLPSGSVTGEHSEQGITLAASPSNYVALAEAWQKAPQAAETAPAVMLQAAVTTETLPVPPAEPETRPLGAAIPMLDTPRASPDLPATDPGLPPPQHIASTDLAALAAPHNPALPLRAPASLKPAPAALPLPLMSLPETVSDQRPRDPGSPPPKDLSDLVQTPPAMPEFESTPLPAIPPAEDAPILPDTPQRLAAPEQLHAPDIDTRLPALRGISPQAPDMPVPPVTDRRLSDLPTFRDQRHSELPVPPAAPTDPVTLPEVDTASASSAQAPARSLRPVHRPDGLAPEPARTTTAEKPKPKKPAAQAARAASSGGGKVKKPSAAASKPAAKPNQKASKQALAKWQSGIARALQRSNRPPKTKATGRVALVLSVAPNGRLVSVRVAGSSGSKVLDQAAIANVKRARFPKAPAGFGQTATVRFTYQFSR